LGDIAAPAVRGLALLPVPSLLCGVFASSCVLMLPAGGHWHGAPRALWRGDWVELRVARRLLLSRQSGVLSLVTGISIVGVALGVWLVIVAMGILSGFEQDLVQKIVGANAHLVIAPVRGEPLEQAPDLARKLMADPEVRHAAAVVEAEVAVAGQSQYAAATLFGIEPDEASEVLDVLHTLVTGKLTALNDPCAPLCPVIIGIELARSLGVSVGDPIRLISAVHETLTPIGPAPKSLGLVVGGVFASKMYDYDSRYIFMGLAAAQKFTAMAPGTATAIELKVRHPESMDGVIARAQAQATAHQQQILAHDAPALQALSWTARNQTLFAALALERVVAAIVLAFIILVASFSIVNTLTMSILERRHEIAMLKTMGASPSHILRIFVAQGVLIGTLGLGMGVALGVGTLFTLAHVPLGIPYEVYYLETLPVRMGVLDIAATALLGWLIVWNFAVFPSLRGAALRPVEGLRDG
jgi:lipoprotein-releasing system permease protein